MERAGRRKYSAPRLLSASGEEAARRAMPTRSAARSGGVGAWRSISRWHGTGGKRGKDSCAVGVDSSERVKARGSGRVAIARLPDCSLYSPSIRLSSYFRFRFATNTSGITVSAAGPKPRRAVLGSGGYTHSSSKRQESGERRHTDYRG